MDRWLAGPIVGDGGYQPEQRAVQRGRAAPIW
jgi:hypothetical protein